MVEQSTLYLFCKYCVAFVSCKWGPAVVGSGRNSLAAIMGRDKFLSNVTASDFGYALTVLDQFRQAWTPEVAEEAAKVMQKRKQEAAEEDGDDDDDDGAHAVVVPVHTLAADDKKDKTKHPEPPADYEPDSDSDQDPPTKTKKSTGPRATTTKDEMKQTRVETFAMECLLNGRAAPGHQAGTLAG